MEGGAWNHHLDPPAGRAAAPDRLDWKQLGIKAIHFWHLEPRGGATFVRTEESYNGLVASLLRRPIQKVLDRSLDAGLRDLKTEVEGRTSR